MSKSKLIPELRFPEFVKDGEWVEKELNELGDLINGLTYSPNDVRGKGLLVLRSSNVQNGQIDLNDCVFVDPEIKGANLTKTDDILVCVRNGSKALIGKNAIIPNEIPFSTHGAFMTVFRAKYPKFVFQLFQTSDYDNQVKADLGATINSINGKNFLKYNFFVPNSKEQQKIASCLSSLDEVIAAHSQKLATLKDHKKGLMQILFPQLSELGLDRLKDDKIKGKEILKSQNPKNHNSDNVPKYRFPEFLKDGDWVEKKLGDICSMQAGKFVSASEIKEKLVPSLFPCYGGNGLRGYTKSFTHSGKFSLIGRQGALCGNITLADGQFHATEHAVVTTPKKNTDTLWLYYELELLNLNQYATGQAQPGLSVGNLVRLKLNIPKNPKEQQKIASCLSALDDLITAQTEKIEQLKLHKKGLMQGLFPKIND